jgi:hypothetical protein
MFVSSILFELMFQMSSRQQMLAALADTANLNAQFAELMQLRDQVRKALLHARKSRRIFRRKRTRA